MRRPVPFGEVGLARLLAIDAPVGKPDPNTRSAGRLRLHAKRGLGQTPVGFRARSLRKPEISSRVSSSRTTAAALPRSERSQPHARQTSAASAHRSNACDRAAPDHPAPRIVVGVGHFAEGARDVRWRIDLQIGRIPHPSPRVRGEPRLGATAERARALGVET
jgi:hypothetical protein